MASLGVHYAKNRLECKDCKRKSMGLVGIVAKCLAIEVHAGATHKYYHPNCFFEGTKCHDVLDKLPYKNASEMTGYKSLSMSDQMLIYSLFASATDDGEDEEENEQIQQRKERVLASRRAKRARKTSEQENTSKDDADEDDTPKKRRRVEKKEKKKVIEDSEEEEVITKRSSNRQSNKRKNEKPVKNIPAWRTASSVDKDEESDEIELPREDKTSNVPKVKQTPTKEKEEEMLPRKKGAGKVPGRGKPSDKMAAIFAKLNKGKDDEQLDLELELDSD